MGMPVGNYESSNTPRPAADISSEELVVGRFHATSSRHMLAFTKWCPPENGIKSFEAAEQAVDLALQRMGQKPITLMQCRSLSYPNFDNACAHTLILTCTSFLARVS